MVSGFATYIESLHNNERVQTQTGNKLYVYINVLHMCILIKSKQSDH